MSTVNQSSSGDLLQNGTGPNSPMTIAGAGAVTGYGWGRKLLWDGFLIGESAVKPTPGLDEYLDCGPP